MPRTSKHALVISALATLALALLPTSASSPAFRVEAVPAASSPWLDRLNQWRTSTGLSTLTEDTTWSTGDYDHAVYMVKNDLVTHYETPGTPYYTTAGDTAARNGNIVVSSTTSTTDAENIDWWMAAPFHAMAMMDPRLTTTGFGSYRDTTTNPWQEGATLDTIRGNSFSGGSYPVYFPGNNSSEPLTTYGGGEFPDPLQACPGYSAPTGLPVFIEVGGNVSTAAGAVHSFTGNGVALSHCVIDSSNAALSSYLYTRGGVIVVPQQPLQTGVKYVVALTVNGLPYTWSFRVGPFEATITSVSPNAGPTAGGTSVTITGTGFGNGVTSVSFGATAATSFTVVNDTTVIAVSPAHAAGTVDVSVTTAAGSSVMSSLDHFTFGACTSVSASAAPPASATRGTAVTFTGVASGCASPLYQFWTLAPGSATWTVAQAYSPANTFVWNTAGLPVGTYHYSVWARDSASSGANTSGLGSYDAFFPGTAYTLGTASCASVTASAAPASPAAIGSTVTFTAAATGCPNPLYEFWTQAPGGSWVVAQLYSTTATFAWSTSGLAIGTYHYSVWVRDASSSAAYDTYFPGAAYTLGGACTSPTASPSPASPQPGGTAVTITASVSGCPNARYEFWIQAPGGSWTVAQPYSTSAVFSWTTVGLTAGTYRYSVWVRDASSSAAYDSYVPGTAYTLTTTPCTSASASASPASPQVHGTTVTFTASATGCLNPRYEFWILAPGSSSWTVVHAYSSASAFTWNTGGLAPGTYRYSVWVRDASSSASYDTYFPGTAYALS